MIASAAGPGFASTPLIAYQTRALCRQGGLPAQVWAKVLESLSAPDVGALSKVSRQFRPYGKSLLLHRRLAAEERDALRHALDLMIATARSDGGRDEDYVRHLGSAAQHGPFSLGDRSLSECLEAHVEAAFALWNLHGATVCLLQQRQNQWRKDLFDGLAKALLFAPLPLLERMAAAGSPSVLHYFLKGAVTSKRIWQMLHGSGFLLTEELCAGAASMDNLSHVACISLHRVGVDARDLKAFWRLVNRFLELFPGLLSLDICLWSLRSRSFFYAGGLSGVNRLYGRWTVPFLSTCLREKTWARLQNQLRSIDLSYDIVGKSTLKKLSHLLHAACIRTRTANGEVLANFQWCYLSAHDHLRTITLSDDAGWEDFDARSLPKSALPSIQHLAIVSPAKEAALVGEKVSQALAVCGATLQQVPTSNLLVQKWTIP